jgi:hypothetical protein
LRYAITGKTTSFRWLYSRSVSLKSNEDAAC